MRSARPLSGKAPIIGTSASAWPRSIATCSIASEIVTICMEEGFDDLDAPVIRVCNEDVPLPYAANLEKLALIDAARIAEGARKVCYKA